MQNNLKIVLALMCSVTSAPGMSGSSGGGTGPPAKEDLQLMLMSVEGGAAGLFRNEAGDIRLGLNRSLDDQIVLMRGIHANQSFLISSEDFDAMTTSENRNIDAVTIGSPDAVSRSYVVKDGDKLGELILKDRREVARNSVK